MNIINEIIKILNSQFVSTIIGVLFGSIITMRLFNKQEKIKVRQELRYNFYCEYNELFKNIDLDLRNIKSELSSFFYELLPEGQDIDSIISFIKNNIKSKSDIDIDNLSEINSLINDLNGKLAKLIDFMNYNEFLTGYSENKFEDIVKRVGCKSAALGGFLLCDPNISGLSLYQDLFIKLIYIDFEEESKEYLSIEKTIFKLNEIHATIKKDFLEIYFL